MRLPLLMILAAGCGGGTSAQKAYDVSFDALVGGQPFSCTKTYANVGTSKATINPQDVRFYVHDLALVRADGEQEPLALDDDGVWQNAGVALLDFEDATGTCANGSTATNTALHGKAAAHDDYTGVAFTVGVPAAQDHLNIVTAKAPLNDPALFWSWTGGYKYLKIEVGTAINATYFFHVGAQNCSGTGDVSCTYPNLAGITLASFMPDTGHVAFDLATLFADSDLDLVTSGVDDPVTGCMSSDGDPECPPLFAKLGLAFMGGTQPAGQTLFSSQ